MHMHSNASLSLSGDDSFFGFVVDGIGTCAQGVVLVLCGRWRERGADLLARHLSRLSLGSPRILYCHSDHSQLSFRTCAHGERRGRLRERCIFVVYVEDAFSTLSRLSSPESGCNSPVRVKNHVSYSTKYSQSS